MGDRRSYNSKEDLTQTISTSVYVTNFPDHCTARDLWNVCLAYGKVVDVYIPFKKSKAGKKFAFVHFLKVDNLERLIGNLCTLWIGRFRLQANPVRFQKESRASNSMLKKGNYEVDTKSFASVLKTNHVKPSASIDPTLAIVLNESCIQEKDLSCAAIGKIKDINALLNLYAILNNEGFDNVKLSYLGGYRVLIKSFSITSKQKLIKHVGVLSWFSKLGHANNSFVSDVRLVWISIEGLPICVWNKDALAKIVSPWGTLSDVDVLEAWTPDFDDEFCDTSSDEESLGEEKNVPIQEQDLDHVSELSCMKENNEFEFNGKAHTQEIQSEDPFKIYDLLNKKDTKEATKGDDPTYPPGFTLKDDAAKEEEEMANSVNQSINNVYSLNNGGLSVKSGMNRSFSLKSGGSIMDVIENLVDIGQTMGYNMEGCKKNLEDIVASHGDSQGNFSFDFTFSPSVGFSRGILCVWDPNIFVKDNVTILDSFVAVRGTWVSSSTKLTIVSVYAPQELSGKKSLWEYITRILDLWDGECIILRDFNEVRSEHERFGTIFNDFGAKAFNHFISTVGLIDLPLEGYSYTWAIKSASKMSKLDRFLVSKGLLTVYPSLSALCLDRHLSDHRPIIMCEAVVDYGSSPFRVYHAWFAKDGFDKLVDDSWNNSNFADSSKITLLRKKFQALKASIKARHKDDNQRSSE
ncbi:RNA-directed DNA polymerase, eukaryota [Tanacetum coccineum]